MNEFDTLKTVFNFLADNRMCNAAAEMWDEALVRWALSQSDQERERKSEYGRFLRDAASRLQKKATNEPCRHAQAILTAVIYRCARRIVFSEPLRPAPGELPMRKSLTDLREFAMDVFGDNWRQALEEAIRRQREERSNDGRASKQNGRLVTNER
jgi:hypothetical protein